MELLVLGWSPGIVTISELTTTGERVRGRLSAPGAIGVGRADLALYAGPTLTVKLPGETRTPFVQSFDGGRTFAWVEPIPGIGSLAREHCRVHTDGTLTVIEDHTLWLRSPEHQQWQPQPLPPTMRVKDVSCDAHGRWHLVGATPDDWPPKTSTTAEYAVVDGAKAQMLPIPLSWGDRRLLARKGGAEQLRRIDAEAAPLLMSSDAVALFDDLSSFIWVNAGKRWNVQRFPHQSICAWVRDGPTAVTVITTDGLRYRTRDSGARWEKEDFRPAIQRAAQGSLSHALAVIAVASRARDVLLAVSAYDWRLPEGQTLRASAVLYSADDGRTFRRVALMEGPTAEYRGLLIRS